MRMIRLAITPRFAVYTVSIPVSASLLVVILVYLSALNLGCDSGGCVCGG